MFLMISLMCDISSILVKSIWFNQKVQVGTTGWYLTRRMWWKIGHELNRTIGIDAILVYELLSSESLFEPIKPFFAVQFFPESSMIANSKRFRKNHAWPIPRWVFSALSIQMFWTKMELGIYQTLVVICMSALSVAKMSVNGNERWICS